MRRIHLTVFVCMLLFVPTLEANAWIIRGYKPGRSETRLGRQQEAQEQLASLKKLNSQLSTLSPDEKKWLQTEYYDELKSHQYHYTNRALAAMNSKEYLLHEAKPQVEEIIGILTKLSNSGLSEKREIYLWANLISLYLNIGLWDNLVMLAGEYGIVEKDLITEKGYDWDKKNPGSIYREIEMNASAYSKHILDDIVLPYLSENLEK